MCNQMEEVNFYGATSTIGPAAEIISEDPNILVVENMVESEVLLMTEEATSWLLDWGAFSKLCPLIGHNFGNIWLGI